MTAGFRRRDRYDRDRTQTTALPSVCSRRSREVGHPRYILDLLARIVTVSLETMTFVDALPALEVVAQKDSD